MTLSKDKQATKKIGVVSWLTGLLAFLTLGLSLYLFPTTLSPGLPLLFGGCFALVVAVLRFTKGGGPCYHWGFDIASGLVLWMVVSAIWGLDTYLSQRGLANFVVALAFLGAMQCAIKSSRDWRLMAQGFLWLCTIASLAAWPRAISVAKETGHIPALAGTFNNPDTFSILPLLGILIALGLVERAGQRLGLVICFQICVLFVTLVSTGCRASLIGLSVGFAAFSMALVFYRRARHLGQLKILLVVPLVLIIVILPLSNFGVSVFDKYYKTASGQALALEETRFEVASYGWKAILNYPVLGAGPECFGFSFQSVRPPGHDNLYVNIAHNDFLEVAVDIGLPGLLLWLVLVFAALYKPFVLLKKGSRPVAAAGILAAVLAITTFSFFNFVIVQRPVLWAQFWVFGLALSFPSSRMVYEEKSFVRYLASVFLFLGGCWVAVWGYKAMQADSLLAQSQRFAQELQIERALTSIEQAINLQPQRANLRLKLVDLEKKWSAFYPAYNSDSARLDALKAAEKSSSRNIEVLLTTVDYYVESGDLDQGAAYLDRALEITPYRSGLHERRASIAVRQGDLKTAIIQLALEKKSSGVKEKLAALLVSLELKSPGQVYALHKDRQLDFKEERVSEALNLAVTNCWDSAVWQAGLSLAKLSVSIDPANLCKKGAVAGFMGKIDGDQAEWNELDVTIAKASPSTDECYARLIARYYQLASDSDKRLKVRARVEGALDDDARIVTARVILSEILYSEKEPLKAMTLVRQGLDLNSHSVLLLAQYARLYELSGHLDLATNYYQEALSIEPNNQSLKANLQRLRTNTR